MRSVESHLHHKVLKQLQAKRMSRYLKKISFISLLFVLFLIGLTLLIKKQERIIPVPEDNGFGDFLLAAEYLNSKYRSEFRQFLTTHVRNQFRDKQKLTEFVIQSSNIYEIVRKGMRKKCVVPIKLSETWTYSRKRSRVINDISLITHVLIAKAKFAEMNRDDKAAMEGYLDAFEFAVVTSYGGLTKEYLGSLINKDLVLSNCTNFAKGLNKSKKEQFISQIEFISSKSETPDVVLSRVQYAARVILDWKRKFYMIKKAITTRSLQHYYVDSELIFRNAKTYGKKEKDWLRFVE